MRGDTTDVSRRKPSPRRTDRDLVVHIRSPYKGEANGLVYQLYPNSLEPFRTA